jgi:UDP-N-acetylmuramate dehydrogenase
VSGRGEGGGRPGDDRVALAAAVLGERARRDVPIGPLTTYRVGGSAALFLEAADEDDLALAARAVDAARLPVLVIGKGSNLLVADAGFPGLAVTMGPGFDWIEISGATVRAGAATSMPVLARRTAAAGLTGMEWAVGVPGSVGGAVRMNAGGHGSDVRHCLVAARVADLAAGGRPEEVPAARLHLGYRHSSLTPGQVVVAAEFALRQGDRVAAEQEISGIVRWRREHQPGGPNAGSVFANPPADSAGRLIDAAGLKGMRHGSAHVSTKHANFIQADDGGSADDVRTLMVAVQRIVEERTGIHLEPEVRLVGFGDDISTSTGG